MLRPLRLLTAAAAGALMLAAAAPPASAQGFSQGQRREIEKIVREYLLKNPDVLQEVVQELEKRQAAAEADRHKSGIADNREKIFNSKHQVVFGNPQGDVTVVEFFDYNCGYCKRALSDKLELVKGDSKLRVVLKEFPVLGPGSIEAAQVSVAAHLQDQGQKFLDFHQKLLGVRGPADKARALSVARESGFDVAKIEQDLQNPEVRATLEEVMQLAETLGINGTPSYVIGNTVVPGAVGLDALKKQIAEVRKQK